MRLCPIVSVVEVRDVSTRSSCEVTSTTSLPPETDSEIGNCTDPPTVMLTPVLSILAKPGASTVTLYVPGGSDCAL